MKIGKRLGRSGFVLITMSILAIGIQTSLAEPDEPGPFERLFRAIRHASREPQHRAENRKSRKRTEEKSDSLNEESNAAVTGGKSNNKPPSERNTRSATRAVSKKGDDLRYGTPVPGKPGLVTSPYSPNGGYIDVRGFAPGTPVKDPYTGKIFLTP